MCPSKEWMYNIVEIVGMSTQGHIPPSVRNVSEIFGNEYYTGVLQ